MGETWWRLVTKCALKVSWQEEKYTCGIYQLCVGMESGVEGDIHYMCLLCQKSAQEEDWGFLLIGM